MAKMGPLAFTFFVLTLALFGFMASSSWGLWESETLKPSDYHSPTACMDSFHEHRIHSHSRFLLRRKDLQTQKTVDPPNVRRPATSDWPCDSESKEWSFL